MTDKSPHVELKFYRKRLIVRSKLEKNIYNWLKGFELPRS